VRKPAGEDPFGLGGARKSGNQIERVRTLGPRTIGIDEIAIRKAYNYRTVVSDPVRKRPS
jgi:hypothetical protein